MLRGNLAPDGAVIKPPAAEPRLHRHSGKAVVFDDYNDMAKRIDDPNLDVDENSVLVLKNAGPLGAPGMPEWGQLPIPKKLLQKGVRDMLRISDARMSGTSYGACVLHVAPESYVGGPLALVADGDVIEIDIPARRLTLKVSDDELARRRAAWKPPAPRFTRGFGAIFAQHIAQANEGCDFDVLERGEADSRSRDPLTVCKASPPWTCPQIRSSTRSRPAASRSACGRACRATSRSRSSPARASTGCCSTPSTRRTSCRWSTASCRRRPAAPRSRSCGRRGTTR